MKREILVFSPPFESSAYPSMRIANQFSDQYKIGLVLTGWSNFRPNLQIRRRDTVSLARSEFEGNSPTLSTLPRAVVLYQDCLDILDQAKPRLVIANHYSMEAIWAAEKRGVPYVATIPMVIGPNSERTQIDGLLASERNVEALYTLENGHDFSLDRNRVELIFNDPFYSGERNLLLTYQGIPPSNYLNNRYRAPYYLIGYLPSERQTSKEVVSDAPAILISFGREVMDSLMKHSVGNSNVGKFVNELTRVLNRKNQRVIFESHGYQILPEYPANWEIYESITSLEVLSGNTIVITDGGYESFHKALVGKRPMIVIPFNDRSKLLGDRAEALGIGINLGSDWILDSELNVENLSALLAQQVGDMVQTMFSDSRYTDVLNALDLTATSSYALLKSIINIDNLSVRTQRPRDLKVGIDTLNLKQFPLEKGQVLFGTDDARVILESQTDLAHRLQIWRAEPFSTLVGDPDALPGTFDKYLDALRFQVVGATDLESNMPAYTSLLKSLRIFMNGETDPVKLCQKGIDFFANLFGAKFLIERFNPTSSYFTVREMAHVIRRKDKLLGKITFYQETRDGWEEVSFEQVELLLVGNQVIHELDGESDSTREIPFDQGVYVSTSDSKVIEAVKIVLTGRNDQVSLVTFGISEEEIKKRAGNIEEVVFQSASQLSVIREQLDSQKTSYGLLVGVSEGLIDGDETKGNVVIVMLLDAFGRTGIGKCEKNQNLNMTEIDLYLKAFSQALDQIE